MKFDKKNILLLILLAISIFFIYKNYFSEDSDYKKKLRDLKLDNERLQRKRDSLNNCKILLEKEFSILSKNSKSLEVKLDSMKNELISQKNKASLSKKELDELRHKLAETKKKIEELKNNPPNRQEIDLINSLKSKMKK